MKDIDDRRKGYENAQAWEDDETQGKRGTEAGSSQVKNDHSFPPLSSRGGLTLGATARTTCSEMVLFCKLRDTLLKPWVTAVTTKPKSWEG